MNLRIDQFIKTGLLRKLDCFFILFISMLLFFSGTMKLASLTYTAEEIFRMFLFTPVGYVNYNKISI